MSKRLLQAAIYEQLRLELGADVALMDALLQHDMSQQSTQPLPVYSPDDYTALVLSQSSSPYRTLRQITQEETVKFQHGAG